MRYNLSGLLFILVLLLLILVCVLILQILQDADTIMMMDDCIGATYEEMSYRCKIIFIDNKG